MPPRALLYGPNWKITIEKQTSTAYVCNADTHGAYDKAVSPMSPTNTPRQVKRAFVWIPPMLIIS